MHVVPVFARAKRESGVNPELPRSGIWERPPSWRTVLWHGKRRL